MGASVAGETRIRVRAKSPGAAPAPGAPKGPGLVRGLDATAAAAIIVGIVIGSGIFRTPNQLAGIVGHTGLIFVVYAIAGVLVFMGALCYAELGAMLPRSGGPYVYTREAYGELPAFLVGWASFTMTQVGSVAAVATFFGEQSGSLVGYTGDFSVKTIAIGAIILLAVINILGVRLGGEVQVVFTGLKIAALVGVILVGIYLGTGDRLALTPVWPTSFDLSIWQAIGLAMVPALFTYDGWTNANNVAEEIKDPQRDLPKALAMGTLFVMAIYIVAHFAFVWALGLDGLIASDDQVAADVFTTAFSDDWSFRLSPAQVITLVIAVSLFGSLNGQTLGYPRLFYAMARDGVLFRSWGKVHPRFHTPHVAIMAQTVWATVLVVFGTFELLIELVIFASFLFYAANAGALIILRVRHPEWDRPYKVLAYPFVPILFIVATLAFTVNLAFGSPGRSAVGLLLVLAGIPVYYLFRRFGKGPAEAPITSGATGDLPDDENR